MLLFFYCSWIRSVLFFFFFNDTATTEIYTLSLHDALPISLPVALLFGPSGARRPGSLKAAIVQVRSEDHRSEEHTSELQSHSDLVCRLLLEKKKNNTVRSTWLANRGN